MGGFPTPSFHFSVDWGGSRSDFSEVSGLVLENEVVEYRGGAGPDFTMIKVPGLKKYTNIRLMRGIVRGDNEFYKWANNPTERRDLKISLMNDAHETIMVWYVKRAFPAKLEGPDLNASTSEIAIETLEVAHEGIAIENS